MAATTCQSASQYRDAMLAALAQLDLRAVDAYAELLRQVWRDDRQVLVFGNGGSAASASHTVADFVKTSSVPGRRRLRALCLSDNIPMMTAIGNDIAFDRIFSHALESYARTGDVAVAISASGNSPNVVHACTFARQRGLRVVSLTGFTGGKIAELCDVHVHVPSDNYGVIEDVHMNVTHMVTQMLQGFIRNEAAE